MVHSGVVFQGDCEILGDEVAHYDDVLHDGCADMTDVVVTADGFAENDVEDHEMNHYYRLTEWNDVNVSGKFHLKIQHSVHYPDSDTYVSAIQIVFCHFQMLYVVVLTHGNSIKVCVKNDFYTWC